MPRLPAPAVARVRQDAWTLATLARAGLVSPTRPDRVARALRALARMGLTPAAGYAAAAAMHPERVAVIDERGPVSFGELHGRTNAIARGLHADGIRPGDTVAVLCRNHRGWIEAVVALSKLGANAVLLNTAFSGPQLAEAAAREGARAMIADAEFAPIAAAAAPALTYTAWPEHGEHGEDDAPAAARTLDALAAAHGHGALAPPPRRGRTIILTSGTTGSPRGATRHLPRNLDPVAALISVIPLRAGERTLIAAPLFHSWGFTHFMLGLPLASTLVLRRRFDPAATLALAARERVQAIVAVPVMAQRMLELPAAERAHHDLSALRIVALSGSGLAGGLATRWMDAFGENLYNLYGSTEVAWATIATPRELRAAPTTAGRPPRGAVVRIVDEDGRELPPGATGRIFVGNEQRFEGYTGGGGKEEIDGLLASGDVGHLDEAGRLFIDGRDDEMIVSGGENVFPIEVEELLLRHDAVADVAVFGVQDADFGQRLKAVVVLRHQGAATGEQLREHVRANLAGYKVPRDVEFLAELPRTSTGKVLKRVLQA